MKNSSVSIMIVTVFMAILSLIAFYFAYKKGEHINGLIMSKDLLLQIIPLLIFVFILAGMLRVLIPADLIAKWIGEESGLKGIFIGAAVGGLLPGGPFVAMPLVAGLGKLGASIPVLVAIMTGWSLFAVSRLPLELGILGPKFTLIRLGSVFIFAPLAGLVAKLIIKIFNIN